MVVKDRSLSALGQRVDAVSKSLDEMAAGADDLARKQAALDVVAARLAQVDEVSKRVTWQFDSLRQSRQDANLLRKDIEEFYKSFADLAQLRDRVGADRAALVAFDERMTSFLARVPELDSRITGVISRLDVVDEGLRRAGRLDELNAELDRQITRVSDRAPTVDKLEVRIGTLNSLSQEIDGRLKEQLERRAELDALRTLLDGVGIQAVDAHQKLQAVGAAQSALLPIGERVASMQAEIEHLNARLKTAQQAGAEVAEQEKRFTELVSTGRTLSTDVAERTRQLQGLLEELKRAASVKDELAADLSRVMGRQRDISAQSEAADDQLRRLETIFTQLEQRRSQLAFAEKKFAGVEARLGALSEANEEVGKRMQEVAAREAVVESVRAQVEAIRDVSVAAKSDLDKVTASRGALTSLRGKVDDLLTRMGQVDDRITAVNAQRRAVDEVHVKTNMIVNMLDDVRLNSRRSGSSGRSSTTCRRSWRPSISAPRRRRTRSRRSSANASWLNGSSRASGSCASARPWRTASAPRSQSRAGFPVERHVPAR